MPTPTSIEVRIGGSTYRLTTPDDEAQARLLCAQADRLVRRILQANPALNQNAALVLALVNALDEARRLEERVAEAERDGAALASRLAESRTEMLRMKALADAASAEVGRLRAQPRREPPRAPWLEGLLDPPAPAPDDALEEDGPDDRTEAD